MYLVFLIRGPYFQKKNIYWSILTQVSNVWIKNRTESDKQLNISQPFRAFFP